MRAYVYAFALVTCVNVDNVVTQEPLNGYRALAAALLRHQSCGLQLALAIASTDGVTVMGIPARQFAAVFCCIVPT